MVDVLSIQNAISSMKTAGNIAHGFLELGSIGEVQSKVIELLSEILNAQTSALAAQAEQSSMIEEVRTTKEEMTRIKPWETEKQRYQMVSPWEGCFVYALKADSKGTEPPHWICQECY